MNATFWANGPGNGGSTISRGAGSSSIGMIVLWALGLSSTRVWVSWSMAFAPCEVRSSADDADRARHPPCDRTARALPQRPEAGASVFHQRLGLLERGEVRANRMLLVVRHLGIALFGPLPRHRA